jgi:hypothetical protein
VLGFTFPSMDRFSHSTDERLRLRESKRPSDKSRGRLPSRAASPHPSASAVAHAPLPAEAFSCNVSIVPPRVSSVTGRRRRDSGGTFPICCSSASDARSSPGIASHQENQTADERDASKAWDAGSQYDSLDAERRRVGADAAGRGSSAADRSELVRGVRETE